MRNLNDLADAKQLIKLAIHAGRLQIKMEQKSIEQKTQFLEYASLPKM